MDLHYFFLVVFLAFFAGAFFFAGILGHPLSLCLYQDIGIRLPLVLD